MKVAWTDRAKARLRKIHDYIAQDSPRMADAVVLRLLQRSRQLQAARSALVARLSMRRTISAS
jgi:plasmid stabilization system protein ParE